jgi:hypothetical protein
VQYAFAKIALDEVRHGHQAAACWIEESLAFRRRFPKPW